MNRKTELYQRCHKELVELTECRQKSFIDKEVENILLLDSAIKKIGLDSVITSKGDELFMRNYYLELAEKEENEERDKELKERNSLINQLSVEKADEQNRINRQMLLYNRITIVFSGIAALGTIIGLMKGCR